MPKVFSCFHPELSTLTSKAPHASKISGTLSYTHKTSRIQNIESVGSLQNLIVRRNWQPK
uniref:Uncharacterized protein n=1 Tax=Arundo donax TaxID=35708 RepID=A0A0A9DSF8_ARUDO